MSDCYSIVYNCLAKFLITLYLILQQETLDDYVITTGKSCQLEDFISASFTELNLNYWHDHVVIDSSLFRLTDIGFNQENAAKAKNHLGWQAKSFFNDIVRTMIQSKLLENKYFKINIYRFNRNSK